MVSYPGFEAFKHQGWKIFLFLAKKKCLETHENEKSFQYYIWIFAGCHIFRTEAISIPNFFKTYYDITDKLLM